MALVLDVVCLLIQTCKAVYHLSFYKVEVWMRAGTPVESVLKSSPVCRRRKSWNVQLYWHRRADVLVKNQERASAEQVTLFLTSQPHQKFFQVSFCVAKDDNGESINAWNEKKQPVCPRGERFHTRQSSLNFRHSSVPFCVRKRRLLTVFFFFLYKRVRGESTADPSCPSRRCSPSFSSRAGGAWFEDAHDTRWMFSARATGVVYLHLYILCVCVCVRACPSQHPILKHMGQIWNSCDGKYPILIYLFIFPTLLCIRLNVLSARVSIGTTIKYGLFGPL